MSNIQNLTYDQLVVYIRDFLKRTDAISLESIPKWINLCEKQLAIKLKSLGAVSILNLDIDDNTDLIHTAGILFQKPYLWHKTKSISLVDANGIRTYLYPRSYEWLQAYLNDFSGLDVADRVENLPRFYCDYNQQYWLFGPYDNSAPAKLEISYYGQIAPLSAENQINFWTTYAPAALIYGTLAQAAGFLRSDDRVALFQGQMESAVSELLGETTGRVNDNVIVRMDT